MISLSARGERSLRLDQVLVKGRWKLSELMGWRVFTVRGRSRWRCGDLTLIVERGRTSYFTRCVKGASTISVQSSEYIWRLNMTVIALMTVIIRGEKLLQLELLEIWGGIAAECSLEIDVGDSSSQGFIIILLRSLQLSPFRIWTQIMSWLMLTKNKPWELSNFFSYVRTLLLDPGTFGGTKISNYHLSKCFSIETSVPSGHGCRSLHLTLSVFRWPPHWSHSYNWGPVALQGGQESRGDWKDV